MLSFALTGFEAEAATTNSEVTSSFHTAKTELTTANPAPGTRRRVRRRTRRRVERRNSFHNQDNQVVNHPHGH